MERSIGWIALQREIWGGSSTQRNLLAHDVAESSISSAEMNNSFMSEW
jgi:hypothetical protein